MKTNNNNEYCCIVDDNGKSLLKFLYTKNKSKVLNLDNCTNIKTNCFKNTTGFEMVCINSESSLVIEEFAFENSSDLKTIVIDISLEIKNKKSKNDDVIDLKQQWCSLPSSINKQACINNLTLQSNAFKNCNSLDCIHIKAEKVTIETNAFSQCYNIRVVVIESNEIHIRKEAFEQSNTLCIIGKSKTLEQFCSKNNIEYVELT